MTPDQKRDAWLRYSRIALRAQMRRGAGRVIPEAVATVADAMMEQAEQREGRFGSEETPPAERSLAGWANPNAVKRMEKELADLQANRDEWMERAQRAEAEVERVKGEKSLMAKAASDADTEAERLRAALALSEEGASTLNDLHDVATERARKAESLLKETLGAAGRLMDALRFTIQYGRPAQGGESTGNVADVEQAAARVKRMLARARKEGFDGE